MRSEQLTVCRVRYGPELYGKIIRIDDDPPTLFVGAPARTRQEGGLVGLISLRDEIRPEARDLLVALRTDEVRRMALST